MVSMQHRHIYVNTNNAMPAIGCVCRIGGLNPPGSRHDAGTVSTHRAAESPGFGLAAELLAAPIWILVAIEYSLRSPDR